MIGKQLSIFIENRKGRIEEVLNCLSKNNVNILSLSLADTEQYGVLRLIVDNPEEGNQKLLECGFSSKITEVLILTLKHECGSLGSLLKFFTLNNINVEYMYSLTAYNDVAKIVVKVDDIKYVSNVLEKQNIISLNNEEVLEFN